MLDGLEFGGERMVFSACRECSRFNAVCLDGNHGFCCLDGRADDCFIPFEYPLLDRDGRVAAIRRYQQNGLPDECRFHTQCSLLNFMEDESVVDGIADEDVSVEETVVHCLDLDEPVFAKALARDSSLRGWCDGHGDSAAFVLRRDGAARGFSIVSLEEDGDYSWILPSPPRSRYLQKGSKVAGIHVLWVDGNSLQDARMLLGMAFMKAVQWKADDIYAVAYEDVQALLDGDGFRVAGYALGGGGSDGEAGACVMVRKVAEQGD